MTITPRHTVKEICTGNATLFAMGNERIFAEIKALPKVEELRLRRGRRYSKDQVISARSLSGITMLELDILNKTDDKRYFFKLLSVMLNISENEVGNLRFIRAYRYFIECIDQLGKIAKKWAELEMPMTAEEQQTHVKQPNRGMVSVCRQYAQLMGGSVRFDDVWNMPWGIVYEAFEAERCKNLQMRKMQALQNAKIKSDRR